MSKHEYFTVKGERFFSIGAQLHNSSGYAIGAESGEKYAFDREWAFKSTKLIGANTVAVPVCWDMFEPEEGKYDTAYVERIIARCREEGLHLSILWFGSWKNGQMEYTPWWVKRDRKRFKRVVMHDGLESVALSPFCAESREADKRAFCKMVETVKNFDAEENTVIAIQVENEPGALVETIRDFSPLGDEAFHAQVPARIIEAAKKDTHMLGDAHKKCGSLESGTWKEVFGNMGAEACMAYGTATYIEDIAAAGKEIYDIFMYINVWLDNNGETGWSMAGMDYPSGGAVSKMLPVWAAVIDAIDAIAPDAYVPWQTSLAKTYDLYAGYDFPFYVPESAPNAINATMLMDGVGNHDAIGWHIFGVESDMNADGTLVPRAQILKRSFEMLENVRPFLEGRIPYIEKYALVQQPGQDSDRIDMGRWLCRASYTGCGPEMIGWCASDWRNERDLVGQNQVPMGLMDETARGLIFRVSEDEFYMVGHHLRLYMEKNDFSEGFFPRNMIEPMHQAHNMEYVRYEEGHFEGDRFVVDRLRSGDEGRHAAWAQAGVGVVHFEMGWKD